MSKSPVSAREQERIRTRYAARKAAREVRNQLSLKQHEEDVWWVTNMSSILGLRHHRAYFDRRPYQIRLEQIPYYKDEFGRSLIDMPKLRQIQDDIQAQNDEFEQQLKEEEERDRAIDNEFDGFIKPGAPLYDVNSVWPAKQIGEVTAVNTTDDGVYLSGTLNDPHFAKQLKSVGFTDFSINEAWHYDYKRKEHGFGKFWRNFKRALNPRNWFE